MHKNGPVIIIDDDADDQELLKEVFENLGYPNKVIFFHDSEKALDFINRKDVMPFLILSDINMPKLNGFELREKLKSDAAMQLKCVPYIFFTTTAEQKAVSDAYGLSVQGFFVKPHSMEKLQECIAAIMHYWQLSSAPNNYP